MSFERSATETSILQEIGARIARHRLNRNLTQEELAEQAGVSRPTIARLEQGSPTNLSNLIRVLRALNLIQNLEALIPSPPSSPIQQLRTKKRQRKRASSTRSSQARSAPWTWGDEE